MCTNPRYIPLRANVSHFLARSRNLVPCGMCEECASLSSSEWSSRIIGEYLDCQGVTLFPTLTYRNSCCPIFDTKTESVRYGYYRRESGKFPCFSKYDIQRFLNTLRKKLERVGYQGLRYFVGCEYGVDPSRTQRPHYHVLLFFSRGDFLPTTESLVAMIADSWHLGTVRYSNSYGPVLQSVNGARYCSKYCCKDITFFGSNAVKSYLSDDLSRDELRRRKKVLNDYKPRHFQSKSFGFGLYKYVAKDISTNADSWLSVKKNGFSIPGLDDTFFLHRYLLDRIRYDVKYDFYTLCESGQMPAVLPFSYRVIKPGFEKTLLPSDYEYISNLNRIEKYAKRPLLSGQLPNIENDTLDLARYMTYQQDRLVHECYATDDVIDDIETYASTYFLYKPFGKKEFTGNSLSNPLYDSDLCSIFGQRESNVPIHYEKKYNEKFLKNLFL